MELNNITFLGPEIDDPAILKDLPSSVSNLLSQINGFILHNGAFHFRGAVKSPDWHSLRKIWKEDESLSDLYPNLSDDDVPFGQDCFGDQFFLRGKEVWVLYAETGEIEKKEDGLKAFLEKVTSDIEDYLNVRTDSVLEPGKLWHAWPPFMAKSDGQEISFKDVPAIELISFHADLSKQTKDLKDGDKFEIKIEN